ncbi:MAG: GAF domain-containing protein [Chthonomonas sp.]|nr:GAF domain-containing protein [Chthonomonas sp.]
MFNLDTIAEITGIPLRETDPSAALLQLAEAALELTASRNVMVARMNDDLGSLELSIGVGIDWKDVSRDVRQVKISAEKGAGIIAYVAAKRERLVTGNVEKVPAYRDLISSSKSEVAMPIPDRFGRIRAVLNMESDQENHYTPEHLHFAEIIADMVGVVIEREESTRREEALELVGSALDRASTEEELLHNVLSIADEVLLFQSCSIFLFDPTQDTFVLTGSNGMLKDKVGTIGYRANEGLTGWVCANGTPLRIDQPQQDERWRGMWLEFPSEQVAAYLAVPIVYRNKSIGAIRVVRRVGDNPYSDTKFTEDDERLLISIAEQTAIGLENIRAVQRAIQIERMAAWGELSAKSSHMIGNRVFALKGDGNELGFLLDDDPMDRDELRKIQQSLMTNIERVEEILQEFRDFVMATQLSTVRADLNFLVRQAVDEVFPRRSEITLNYDFESTEPVVEVDARKMRRAISEIVENGLSFFEKGVLSVRTFIAGADIKKLVGAVRQREYYGIEIIDQGPGVEEDRKEMIFQPFHSSRVKGMGLGLSIVKGIVEAHGGAVAELGELGSGARFVILLPVPKSS